MRKKASCPPQPRSTAGHWVLPWVSDADATSQVGKLKGLPDGMAVDRSGNVFATGPGGVSVFATDGTLLGRIDTGQATANCTFGEDGSVLYVTAAMYLCRIRTKTKGLGF